jgi:hypothetical protein
MLVMFIKDMAEECLLEVVLAKIRCKIRIK